LDDIIQVSGSLLNPLDRPLPEMEAGNLTATPEYN
jgi:hypothetical protein